MRTTAPAISTCVPWIPSVNHRLTADWKRPFYNGCMCFRRRQMITHTHTHTEGRLMTRLHQGNMLLWCKHGLIRCLRCKECHVICRPMICCLIFSCLGWIAHRFCRFRSAIAKIRTCRTVCASPDPNRYRRCCPDPNARIQKFIP